MWWEAIAAALNIKNGKIHTKGIQVRNNKRIIWIEFDSILRNSNVNVTTPLLQCKKNKHSFRCANESSHVIQMEHIHTRQTLRRFSKWNCCWFMIIVCGKSRLVEIDSQITYTRTDTRYNALNLQNTITSFILIRAIIRCQQIWLFDTTNGSTHDRKNAIAYKGRRFFSRQETMDRKLFADAEKSALCSVTAPKKTDRCSKHF